MYNLVLPTFQVFGQGGDKYRGAAAAGSVIGDEDSHICLGLRIFVTLVYSHTYGKVSNYRGGGIYWL